MEQRLVHRLEEDLEAAIAEVLEGFGKRLPFHPSHHTIHLMAKSAVTVYEAAFENRSPGPPRDDHHD